MTTVNPTPLLLLFSALIAGLTGCTGAASEGQPATQGQILAPSNSVEGFEVTVVKVKAPWYAFDFILPSQFKKVIPVYEQVAGLRFKAFSILDKDEKTFGGIYLWDSEQRAREWYTPTWFADIEQKRGHKPTVDHYSVVKDVTFVDPNFDYQQRESDCVTVFVHAINPALGQQCLTQQPGLLRTYLVRETGEQEGALLLFANTDNATAFLERQKVDTYDWFKTPVLLNNVR